MKNNIIYAVGICLIMTACVQKTYKRTVVFILNTKDMKGIYSVGLRGVDQPLSWDHDLPMVAVKKDTIYKATISFFTGYKFTEVKFVVNDQFELKDKANRRVNFNGRDTTIYQAEFNDLK